MLPLVSRALLLLVACHKQQLIAMSLTIDYGLVSEVAVFPVVSITSETLFFLAARWHFPFLQVEENSDLPQRSDWLISLADEKIVINNQFLRKYPSS